MTPTKSPAELEKMPHSERIAYYQQKSREYDAMASFWFKVAIGGFTVAAIAQIAVLVLKLVAS